MLSWLNKSVPIAASALFHGSWPLRKDGFDHLKDQGVTLTDLPASETAVWSLELNHPEWGKATLVNLRNMPMPPLSLIEYDPQLTPAEVEEISKCGSMVSLMMEGQKHHILRDRKNALYYLDAILGVDGIAALDHVGQKFWPREALKFETAQSGDLDVNGIITYHFVTSEGGEPVWFHTHGLGEVGFFDFDIIRPSEDLAGSGQDLLRAIAWQIIEGRVKPGSTFSPLGNHEILPLSVEEFTAKASPQDRALRDDDSESHSQNRVVLCEPKKSGLKAFFGSSPHPSRLLSSPFDEGALIQFSYEASRLMAERAKATIHQFHEFAAELAEFESTPAAKLSYQTDDGNEDKNEHLWFEVHGVVDGKLDATLLNTPFRIAGMKEGDRGLHEIQRLSDWLIFTPLGNVTPRNTKPLRFIRQNKEQLRETIRQGMAEGREG